ncbi:MAG: hypothetical protein D6719_04645 [Candidatus Dadabacteria bacterium]|nr:MAG: hypothetical protein D6719_04645 [Candidatus Dadabacteria bacterium]
MDPITGLVASKAIQEVSKAILPSGDPKAAETAPADKSSSSDFEAYMRQILPASTGNTVNEEQLFAALIQERITALKGEEAGQKFQEAFTKNKQAMRRADGYTPVEDAARAALKEMVSQEVLTSEEADTIHSQAFAGAQLDDNKDALYDGRGGEGDNTIAIETLDAALLAARALVEKYDSGELEAELKPYATTVSNKAPHGSGAVGTEITSDSVAVGSEQVTASGGHVDGPNGFLWKPASDNDGKLVVLLPESFTGKVASVILKNEDDEKVEKGRASGVANGGREHFRFNRSGEDYPDNITVEVKFKNGKVKTFKIPDPSKRYD